MKDFLSASSEKKKEIYSQLEEEAKKLEGSAARSS